MEDNAVKLMQWVKQALRKDMVNGYTALSPRAGASGAQVMRVKDEHTARMLTITVTEDKEQS